MNRWLRSALLATFVLGSLACSTSSGASDDSVTGAIDAGVGPTDADVSDVEAPVDCRAPTDGGTCADCCRSTFAAGYAFAGNELAAFCICGDGGVDGGALCATECEGACTTTPSDACATCLRSGIEKDSKCYESALTKCAADKGCAQWLGCSIACPATGM